ncbi:MAG: DUF1761 domain-containing protein [Hyphomicrobiaceae bacterium]
MAFAGVNFWAIIAAAVAGFLFGGLYYGLLSRQWLSASGQTMEEVQKTGMLVPMAISAVALLIMAWVLAGIVGHFGPGRITVRHGLITGGLSWLGFVATTIAVNHAYQGARRTLTLIDTGHWLGVLLIQGAVIGWLGALS